eukprot:PhM_4_TR18027/c7_g1_i1/m.93091
MSSLTNSITTTTNNNNNSNSTSATTTPPRSSLRHHNYNQGLAAKSLSPQLHQTHHQSSPHSHSRPVLGLGSGSSNYPSTVLFPSDTSNNNNNNNNYNNNNVHPMGGGGFL